MYNSDRMVSMCGKMCSKQFIQNMQVIKATDITCNFIQWLRKHHCEIWIRFSALLEFRQCYTKWMFSGAILLLLIFSHRTLLKGDTVFCTRTVRLESLSLIYVAAAGEVFFSAQEYWQCCLPWLTPVTQLPRQAVAYFRQKIMPPTFVY